MKWKMVPVEPTVEMFEQGEEAELWELPDDTPAGLQTKSIAAVYSAMLEAAPKYEPTDEQVEAGARALCRLGKPRGHTCAQACPWQEDGDEYYCPHATETHGGRARAVLMTLEG